MAHRIGGGLIPTYELWLVSGRPTIRQPIGFPHLYTNFIRKKGDLVRQRQQHVHHGNLVNYICKLKY